MIPPVRALQWQAYPERPLFLLRRLVCSRCGATLAVQRTDDPADPYQSWPTRHPFPFETRLRAEMIRFPGIASISAPGRPVFGQQRALRQGKAPRPLKRLVEVVEVPLRARESWDFDGEGVWHQEPGPSEAEWEAAGRRARRRTSGHHPRRPVTPGLINDFIPGEHTIWFNQYAPLPCELFCLNCGVRHLLTGQGPEGPAPDDPLAREPPDARDGWTNLGWLLHLADLDADEAIAVASSLGEADRLLALLETERTRVAASDPARAARVQDVIEYVRTNRVRIENVQRMEERRHAWAVQLRRVGRL